LRQFEHVGYWQDPAAWSGDSRGRPPPAVVLSTQDVQEAVEANLAGEYHQHAIGLRPQVLLSVRVREDLWRAFTEAAAGRP
jgi:hypothetical protein